MKPQVTADVLLTAADVDSILKRLARINTLAGSDRRVSEQCRMARLTLTKGNRRAERIVNKLLSITQNNTKS